MLTIADLPNIISGVLQKNLTTLKDSVARNMQANDQYVTGQTESELRVEVDGSTGILFGAKHMDTLEVGISPERSREESWIFKFHAFFIWQAARSLEWDNRHIAQAVTRQEREGSLLHRMGIKLNVYSDEIPTTVESIKNEIGQNFVNIKIVN